MIISMFAATVLNAMRIASDLELTPGTTPNDSAIQLIFGYDDTHGNGIETLIARSILTE